MCCLATTQQIDTAHTTWPNRPCVHATHQPATHHLWIYKYRLCAHIASHRTHTYVPGMHNCAYSSRYWKAPDDVYPCLHLNEQPQCCLASGWFILCAVSFLKTSLGCRRAHACPLTGPDFFLLLLQAAAVLLASPVIPPASQSGLQQIHTCHGLYVIQHQIEWR